MRKNKIILSAFLSLVIMIILMGNILAGFGVSSRYYNGYPMYLPAGQTQTIQLILQNSGPNNVSVIANIKDGADIISLLDSSSKYFIPIGERTLVNLKVTVPSNAKPYQDFPINIGFTEIADKTSGFGILGSIDQSFDVVASRGPVPVQTTNQTLIFGLIIAIVLTLTAIVFFVVKKNRRH